VAEFVFDCYEVEGCWGEDVGPDHGANFWGEEGEGRLGLVVKCWSVDVDWGGWVGVWRWGADCTGDDEVADCVCPGVRGLAWIVVPDAVGVAEGPGVEVAHFGRVFYVVCCLTYAVCCIVVVYCSVM
jgi:hypothetical protein